MKEWSEDEYRRMIQFHDNVEKLYHKTIADHQKTISIHAIGDLLKIAGEIKEVQII